MPKYKKKRGTRKKQKKKKRQKIEDLKAHLLLSASKAFLVGLGFLIASLLFNLEIVDLFGTPEETWLKVADVLVKGGCILGFFFFGLVALINTRELRGKVSEWQDLVLLSVISILQGVLSGWVVLTAVVGIVLILLYLWTIQVKLEKNQA